MSKQYFNLQLLCAASILLMTSANGSPILAQRYSSTSATNISTPSATQRPIATLDDVTITKLDQIQRNTANIQKQLNMLQTRNRFMKLLSLIAVGQAVYIVNDKDLGGIASTLKKECKTRYQQLLKVMDTLTKGFETQTPAQSKNDVVEEKKSSVVDEPKKETENND